MTASPTVRAMVTDAEVVRIAHAIWTGIPRLLTERSREGSTLWEQQRACWAAADRVAAYLNAAPPPPANIGADSPSAREKALREAVQTVRQQLVAYTAAHPDEQELRRFLEKWDAILATPAKGGSDG